MASSLSPAVITRLTGTTNETVISANPAILLALIPEATTTGTVTVRNQATAAGGTGNNTHIAAIGLTQQGKQFGPFGVVHAGGLTVQNSVSGDAVAVVWMPLF